MPAAISDGPVAHLHMLNGDTVAISTPDEETATRLCFAINECIADAVYSLQQEELLKISPSLHDKLSIKSVNDPFYRHRR